MYQVLLVDDEPAMLEAERWTIRKYSDFEVMDEAYSVDQAIQVIQKKRPDVILTDMKMPKKSGVELIKYVSEMEGTPIVCIAVSGYSDFDYVREAFLYGAFDYLLKPIEPEKYKELFYRIGKHLEKRVDHDRKKTLFEPKLTGRQLADEIDAYIHRHLAEDISIIQICGKFMISQPYLSKIFKKYKGCTYNEYVNKVKMDLAKQYMQKNYLVGEVAEMLGFADQFYFSKVFKAETGYSPRDYRKKVLEMQ